METLPGMVRLSDYDLENLRRPDKRHPLWHEYDRKYKELRAILWYLQDGKCWWCGKLTELPKNGEAPQSALTATLDHLKDKYAAKLKLVFHGNILTVMACHKCNCHRSAILHSIATRSGKKFLRKQQSKKNQRWVRIKREWAKPENFEAP